MAGFSISAMVANVRRVWRIIPVPDRRGWGAAIVLGVAVAVFEVLTAVAVLVLVARLAPNAATTGRALFLMDSLQSRIAPQLEPTSFAGIFLLLVVTMSLSINILHLYVESQLTSRAYVWGGVNLLRAYLQSGYVWFHQQNSADFVRNIQESANFFSAYVLLPVSRVFREGLIFVGVCAIALAARPELAPLAAVFAALYFVIHWLPSRFAARLGRASERNKRDQQQALAEAFDLFDEIRVNGLTAIYLERFARPRREYRRIQIFRQLNESVPSRLAEWVVLACLVGAIIVIGEAMRDSALRDYWTQTFVFALYLAYRLRSTLTGILGSLVLLRFGWPAFLNVERGLATPVGFNVNADEPIKFGASLRLVDVTFVYPGAEGGIRNVDLAILRGSWVGIGGRSGSGKTTLAAIIMGLVRPQRGSTLLDGHEANLDCPGWYDRIGFVSQRLALIDGSLKSNIVLDSAARCDETRLARAIALAQLDTVIAELPGGLDGRVGERGALLSGGQRQRVALARALYREAEILVLDEATSSLDVETEAALMRALEPLRGKVTLVAISHRKAILDQCDSVLWLNDGGVFDPVLPVQLKHSVLP